VNSEGSELQHSAPSARMSVSVGVKADDGMSLARSADHYAATAAELASEAIIDDMIESVTAELEALHAAPVVDPFVGPAILDGRAAAVFMHEVFGHRIEAHRQEHRVSGQTFADKVGDRIMPAWLSIYDDPTVIRLNDHFLSGHYRYDDEGVRAQRAHLVEDGVLRGFVQGRQPLAGFPRSNGHGRKEPGHLAVSRQGNLIVEAAKSVTREELEERLLQEVRRQGKPYGMVFTEIAGGMTNTTRLGPQSFKVHPVMAYRLYPDGRRELVRGVDIVGTPLSALASIRAAGRPVETFNGMCGAESGWVPVSASSPSLLLESLEVERSFTPAHRPPVLSPPQ
jgi:TldD protein